MEKSDEYGKCRQDARCRREEVEIEEKTWKFAYNLTVSVLVQLLAHAIVPLVNIVMSLWRK